MPYQDTVTSRILLATTDSGKANLGNTVFTTTNTYHSERLTAYNSFNEVKEDAAVPNTSVAYAALRLGFQQPGASVPIYLGRRLADDLTLTPDPIVDNADYSVTFEVIDDLTQTKVTTVASIDSGAAATIASIATALFTEIDVTEAIANITAVDNTGSITITADAGYTFNAIGLERLLDTYTTTETSASLLTAIQDEDNQNWYYFECDDHSETFILGMAPEIEATETSNYPKIFITSTQEATSIVPLPSPAVDIMGKLKEIGYNRTMCRWHDQADTLFPEIAVSAYNGQFQPTGKTTWKYMTPVTGIPAAADLVTGKPLTTAKQGYISDRFGSWHGIERNINFAHGGKTSSGEWLDIINSKDWLNDEIETALLNLLLNQPGGKISPDAKGKQKVKTAVDNVLGRAVGFNILDGYEPTTIPEITSFSDQAARIMRDIDWVGYLKGAAHFMVVNGILTYKDEPIT